MNLAVSEALYARHPDDDEGVLSARRAAIVSTPGLARLATRIDLGAFLLLGEGEAQRGGRVATVAARVGVRGPGRRASTSTSAGTPHRDWLHAMAAAELDADLAMTHAQEPQEPAPGAHPADDRRAGRPTGVVEAGRPRPRRSGSGSRSPSRARRSGWATGPSRRVAETAAAAQALEVLRHERAAARSADRRDRRLEADASPSRTTPRERAGPPAAAAPPGLQVVRRADAGRVRPRDQRRRRAQRVRQEQPRGRAALGARRAGSLAPHPHVRGRHLGRAPSGGPRIGMADVTLVLDNGDGLLPVEYGVIELGRRLYRSGENDYLLNRQRVRLRDLVDLLDSANLAENAFLFIGQGMVDQALALRPEERRPLFEEVAGVRRHERRRRRAEEQLVEAEANLARVDDILAELRPQARRLGQLRRSSRRPRMTAGEELAAALIVAAHGRWHEAAARAGSAEHGRDALRAEGARALEALERAETEVGAIATSMAARSELEAERRDGPRGDAGGTDRAGAARGAGDRRRRSPRPATGPGSRASGRRPRRTSRRTGGRWPCRCPSRTIATEAQLAEADRALAEGLSELGSLRAASRARGDELAAVQRAEAARAAEAETARRRLDDATRRSEDEGRRATEARGAPDHARSHDCHASARPWPAPRRRRRPRSRRARRPGSRSRRRTGPGAPRRNGRPGRGTALAGIRGQVDALERRLARRRGAGHREGRAAGRRPARRRRPGRRSGAADGGRGGARRAARARTSVRRGGGRRLSAERGQLAVRERIEAFDKVAGGGTPSDLRRLDDAVASAHGGRLRDAIRRDPGGAARALLDRAVWVPDLAAALRIQPSLPVGWIVATRDGGAVLDAVAVRIGRGDSPLEARAEAERLGREAEARGGEAAEADTSAGSRRSRGGRGAGVARRSADRESPPSPARRRAEEQERAAGRAAEAAARESAWHARAGRSAGRRGRARRGRRGGARRCRDARTRRRVPPATPPRRPPHRSRARSRPGSRAWPSSARGATGSRPTSRRRTARAGMPRPVGPGRRPRSASRSAGSRRPTRELEALAGRERAAGDERTAVASALAQAAADEFRAREALEALLADDRAERTRLAEAERAATAAREQLRHADDRARASDVAAMEARLNLDVAARAGAGRARGAGRGRAAAPRRRRRRAGGRRCERGAQPRWLRRGRRLPARARRSRPRLDTLAPTLGRRRRPPASRRRPAGWRRCAAATTSSVRPTRSRSTSTPSVRARLETLDAQDTDLREAIGGPAR